MNLFFPHECTISIQASIKDLKFFTIAAIHFILKFKQSFTYTTNISLAAVDSFLHGLILTFLAGNLAGSFAVLWLSFVLSLLFLKHIGTRKILNRLLKKKKKGIESH